MKKYLAEAIGTFALVFCGTGAIIINDITNGVVGHQGVAMTFGLIVTVMIYAFGPISGAHINPAVTIGFAISKRFSITDVPKYILAQMIGAVLASIVLTFLFPLHENLGATIPAGSAMQSFVLEIILTYFLMLVILMVGQSQEPQINIFTGVVVGATVGLEALFAGPICGASMNPARSLAPSLISGVWTSAWVYVIAPVLGAILATLTWRYFDRKE